MGRAERRVWPSLLQTTNNGAAGCSFRRRRDHHTMQGQSQGQGRPPLRLRPRRDIFSANLEIVVQINSGQALVHSGRPFVRRLPSHSSLRSIMDHSVGASKPERSTGFGFGFAPQSRVRAPPSLLRSAPVSGVTVIRCWTSTHRSIGRSVDGAFASVITCGSGGVHVLGFTTLVSSVNHEALKARREPSPVLLGVHLSIHLYLFMRNGNNKPLNKRKES